MDIREIYGHPGDEKVGEAKGVSTAFKCEKERDDK